MTFSHENISSFSLSPSEYISLNSTKGIKSYCIYENGSDTRPEKEVTESTDAGKAGTKNLKIVILEILEDFNITKAGL